MRIDTNCLPNLNVYEQGKELEEIKKKVFSAPVAKGNKVL